MKTINDLKQIAQWVGYTAQKVPMNPHNGRAASSTDPTTWATASEAWAARRRYGWAGIGYVFTIDAGVIGVDLDDCFDDEGRPSDTAVQLVTMLDSYTELSPSGRGLHILALGGIPHSVKTPGVEIYNEMRYFTVTGNRWGATSPNIEDRNAELNALFVTYGGDIEPAPPRLANPRPAQTTQESDVRRALSVMPKTGDYNTYWLKVLMAVHDAFPNETGVRLIEEWSPGYRGEVARKWRSFDRTAKDGVTIATLFHLAKQYGYEQAAKRPQRLTSSQKQAILARA